MSERAAPTEGADEFFAHSLADRPIEEWERLEDHLARVSDMAAEFAARFQARD